MTAAQPCCPVKGLVLHGHMETHTRGSKVSFPLEITLTVNQVPVQVVQKSARLTGKIQIENPQAHSSGYKW